MTSDPYPSTFDAPRIMGGQDDLVLEILRKAYRRYVRGASSATYIGPNGIVCAVGAVIKAAGVTLRQYTQCERKCLVALDDLDEPGGVVRLLAYLNFEQEVIEATKTAMALLDESAAELYPWSADGADRGWCGPLEFLNQARALPWPERQAAVKRCYKRAIAKRQGISVPA